MGYTFYFNKSDTFTQLFISYTAHGWLMLGKDCLKWQQGTTFKNVSGPMVISVNVLMLCLALVII